MAAPTPNSSTGGYMQPATPGPPYDDALENVLHDVIVGITGLAASLVRPRFQPEPPDQPDRGVEWIAFGITDTETDWDPYEGHDPTAYGGDGANRVEQDEEFTVLLSFYGPNASWIRALFETGIKLAQNRSALEAVGTKLVGLSRTTRVPALLKQRWYNRIDQRLMLKRRIILTYPVLTIQSANITLNNEQYITDIQVNPPTP